MTNEEDVLARRRVYLFNAVVLVPEIVAKASEASGFAHNLARSESQPWLLQKP